MSLKTYGVTSPIADGGTLAQEELARNGFTVLPGSISPELVVVMREALDRLLVAQTTRFGGEQRLSEIGDAWLVRAPLEEEPVFLELLRLPALDSLVDAILGPAALVMQQNGIIIPPIAAAHHQQSWHRDLPYQEFTSSKPIALGSLAVLDAFTTDSGGTRFLPSSHRHEKLPSEDYVARWTHQPEAAAGDVIVFDAMVFHAGGVNSSRHPRRAVNTLFGIPLLAQQVALKAKPGMDLKMRRRLGLDYQPAATADAWRSARHTRLHGEKP